MNLEEIILANKKRERRNINIVILVFIFAAVLFIVIVSNIKSTPEPVLSQQQKDSIAHVNWIKQQFNAWDGSHIKTTEYIKNNMNDPNSYEHVETTYRDFGKLGLVITTKFRCKNMFGGVVTQYAVSKIDSTGTLYDLKFVTQ